MHILWNLHHFFFRWGIYGFGNSEVSSILTLSLHLNLAFIKEICDFFFKFILLFLLIKMLTFDVFHNYIVSYVVYNRGFLNNNYSIMIPTVVILWRKLRKIDTDFRNFGTFFHWGLIRLSSSLGHLSWSNLSISFAFNFNPLKFLSHPEELCHLFSIDPGVDELTNWNVILCSLIFLLIFDGARSAEMLNLFQLSPLLRFLLILRLCKLRVDDGKGQIEQEECSDKHDRHKHQRDIEVVLCNLHIPLDLAPSFKRHKLEDCLERVDDVIPVGHSIVHVLVHFEALVSTRALVFADVAEDVIFVNHTCLDTHASLLEFSCKHLCACDGEDNEKEQEDEDRIFEHR